MSATIYPPMEIAIFDPGNVPEIWVDGCAYYFEKDGVVRTGFYVTEPALPISEGNQSDLARLCFRFRCTVQTQRAMKEQVTLYQNGAWAAKVGQPLVLS